MHIEPGIVDGTKIEANANRYTFVWGKAVVKHKAKLQEKVQTLLAAKKARHPADVDTAATHAPTMFPFILRRLAQAVLSQRLMPADPLAEQAEPAWLAGVLEPATAGLETPDCIDLG